MTEFVPPHLLFWTQNETGKITRCHRQPPNRSLKRHPGPSRGRKSRRNGKIARLRKHRRFRHRRTPPDTCRHQILPRHPPSPGIALPVAPHCPRSSPRASAPVSTPFAAAPHWLRSTNVRARPHKSAKDSLILCGFSLVIQPAPRHTLRNCFFKRHVLAV